MLVIRRKVRQRSKLGDFFSSNTEITNYHPLLCMYTNIKTQHKTSHQRNCCVSCWYVCQNVMKTHLDIRCRQLTCGDAAFPSFRVLADLQARIPECERMRYGLRPRVRAVLKRRRPLARRLRRHVTCPSSGPAQAHPTMAGIRSTPRFHSAKGRSQKPSPVASQRRPGIGRLCSGCAFALVSAAWRRGDL